MQVHQSSNEIASLFGRRFGKPTVFVTITTNPAWEEIQPKGDPFISVRVFKMMSDLLLRDIIDGLAFGSPAIYWFAVTEFQKRGKLSLCRLFVANNYRAIQQ